MPPTDIHLTPLSYQILLALADAPLHGYGIIKEIAEWQDESSAPSTGALYLALQRLTEEGWIEQSPDLPKPGEDSRRKYYRLTQAGRARATDESARLEALVGLARERALLPGSAG